jgi:hypothetical protein
VNIEAGSATRGRAAGVGAVAGGVAGLIYDLVKNKRSLQV